MIRLIRVELFKLRTMRVTFGLFGAAAGLTILFAILESTRTGHGNDAVQPLFTTSGLTTVTTVTGWAMLLAAVLGVIVASGEFRHRSATLTYLTTPRRNQILIAKAAATAMLGATFGLVGSILATSIGLIFVAAHGYHIALGTATLLGHGAGAMVGGALLGAVGVGVGSLVRSQLAGVIGVFVWAIVIESLVGGLFTSVRAYLPYTAATSMAGAKLGNAAFGPAHGLSGGNPLPFAAATALIAAVAVVISLTAANTTVARDIT